MVLALIFIAVASVAFFAGLYGYRRQQGKRQSRGGWYGFGVLVLLAVGVWIAGNTGNESFAYGLGMALVLALPALLVIGIASAVGASIRSREIRREQRQHQVGVVGPQPKRRGKGTEP